MAKPRRSARLRNRSRYTRPPRRATPVNFALLILVLGVALLFYSRQPDSDGSAPGNSPTQSDQSERSAGSMFLAGPYQVGGVTVTDIQTGRQTRLGTVDLRPTLRRIEAGERNPHRNDGSVYRNLSKQLPERRLGHYREFVVPTPGINGPGPQRLVMGLDGEIFYTPDHYETFIQLEARGFPPEA
ncbi:MAG: ribonuclease [Planctomycetes bacterium]|nr:ribonuclease [Planctomycetota bacterium]